MTDEEVEAVLEEVRADNRRQLERLRREVRLRPSGLEGFGMLWRVVTYPWTLTSRVWRRASDAGRVMMACAGLCVLVLLLGVLSGCSKAESIEVTVSRQQSAREITLSGTDLSVGDDVPVVTVCGARARVVTMSPHTLTVVVPADHGNCPVTVSTRYGTTGSGSSPDAYHWSEGR